MDFPKTKLFGLNFAKVTLDQAAQLMMEAAKEKKHLVVTPNVDQLVQLKKDDEVLSIYQQAEFVFVDGMPIVWFSRMLPEDFHLPERVNGTNLMYQTCSEAAKVGFSIALIGGKPGAAELASIKLKQELPGLQVAGHYCPPFGFEKNHEENQKIISMVNEWKPDFLFVGVGNPKQEKWIVKNWENLHFKVAMGIGSAIELIAGQVKRAPIWMQRSGLEWMWRVLQEPGRMWKRYFIQDMAFFPLAWNEYKKIKRKNY